MTDGQDNSGSTPALPSPQRCGKYVLHRKLGTGGMAEVFLAEAIGPSGFGKRVALKRLLPNVAADEEFIDSFISEARLGGALEHPNIVQTLELGQEGETWYLAMELVQGLSLTSLIRLAQKGMLSVSPAVVLEIVRQLCAGLAYAHTACDARGRPLHLIHRDLKPANILINRFGQLKICDFGIARSAASIRNTLNAGVLKGTVSYMSPEQAACLELDQRSDLYSLGAILFELLTLQPLYPGGCSLPGLYDVMRGDVSARLPLLAQTHPLLAGVVTRLLAFDPGARYASATEVSGVLQGLFAEAGGGSEALGILVSNAISLGGQSDAERSFSLSERDHPPISRVIPLGRAALTGDEPPSLVLDPASRMGGTWITGGGTGTHRPARGPAPETLLSLEVGAPPAPTATPVTDSRLSAGRIVVEGAPYGAATSRGLPPPVLAPPVLAPPVLAPPVLMSPGPVPLPAAAASAPNRLLLSLALGTMLVGLGGIAGWTAMRWGTDAGSSDIASARVERAQNNGNDPAGAARVGSAEGSTRPSAGPLASSRSTEGATTEPAGQPSSSTSAPATPAPATPAPATPTPAARASAGGRVASSAASSASGATKPARSGGKAYLTVNARPYAYVFVNGKKLPEPTPLFDFPLEAGTYRLTFKTEDGRSKGPIPVELRPGEHKQLPSVVFE